MHSQLKKGDVIYRLYIALTKRGLTWNSDGKLFRFNGQKPPTQLIMTAVCRTNQSDGAFTIGRLVIK